jgi:hypothetical protein
MGNLTNCSKCGSVYVYDTHSYSVCPRCKSGYDVTYNLIRDYLMNHPNCSLMELATKFKLPVRTIKSYIEDDRLSIR